MPTLSKTFSAPLIRLRDRWMFSDRLPGKRGQWPVRSESPDRTTDPFFVLGHPRSGTTLLRSLLSRHPDVFIPPENGGLWRMIRVFGDTRGGDWSQVVDNVLQEFEGGYEYHAWEPHIGNVRDRALNLPAEERSLQGLIRCIYHCYGQPVAPGKSRWGDKTTPGDYGYLDKLALVFPRASYVHIIRDGRDCVVSAMKVGFYNGDFRQAAKAWRDNVRKCRRLGDSGMGAGSYLELQYETLVDQPEAPLKQVCEVLGIESHPAMLQHDDTVDRLPDINTLEHHANVARPVFSSSVGKWRTALTEEQCGEVERIMGSELVNCGYELQSS